MKNLIIKGQGVFVFPLFNSCMLLNKEGDDGLCVKYGNLSVTVTRVKDNSHVTSFNTDINTKFFISLNSQTQIVCFGIGEARKENLLHVYEFDPSMKQFLESIETISDDDAKIIKDPIKRNIPLLIKDKNDLTMNDVATDKYMPASALSPVCRQMYNCISGKKFLLNSSDFPDFSKAIDYSIKTPGMWCNRTLIDKSNEFGKPNINETYLRITLGSNNGESPGVPYVMEIWPVGHYSPIHSHSSANAIIRVLRGEIDVALYPYLGSTKEFANCLFKKGDVTWILPSLNQTHQLKNNGKKTCVTLQCYMYDHDDKVHYDYFDYIDEDKRVQQYEPQSDMDFVEFKELMKKEWKSRKRFNF
jgi:uncharacterized cupin superfamily protein